MRFPRRPPSKSIAPLTQPRLHGAKPSDEYEPSRGASGQKERLPYNENDGRKPMRASITSQHDPTTTNKPSSSSSFGHRLKNRFQKVRQRYNNKDSKENSKSLTNMAEDSASRQLKRDLEALGLDDESDDSGTILSLTSPQSDGTDTNNGDDMHRFMQCVQDMVGTKDGRQNFLQTSVQREQLISEINHDYTEMLLDQSILGEKKGADLHLEAARHVIKEFFTLVQTNKYIQTNRKKRSNHKKHQNAMMIQQTLYQVLEQYIIPRIADQYDSLMGQLTKEDAAHFIGWMDKLFNDMNNFCPQIVMDKAWKRDHDRLLEHYLVWGVVHEMHSLLRRALDSQSKDGAVQLLSGDENRTYLSTDFVDQVGSIYQQQLSMASDLLPSSPLYQETVLAACNRELARSVCDLQLKISAQWKEIGIRNFCAIINDAVFLSKQCEKRNQDSLTLAEFQQEAMDLIRDLSDLALHATQYLCERILLDLRHPEGDDNAASRTTEPTISTLKHHFENIETWLLEPCVYFPKVLKTCFDLTLQSYLESFFADTLARGVPNAATASREIRQDYLRLVIFFNGACCERYRAEDGEFYTQFVINERLRILQNVAAIVDPKTTQPNKEDIKGILSHFSSGENGSAVILHLAGLRKRHVSNIESIMWVKTIASAKKEMAIRAAKRLNSDKKSSGDSDGTGGNGVYGKVTKQDLLADDDDDDDDGNRSSTSSSRSAATDDLVVDLSYNVPDLRNSKFLLNMRPPKTVQREISGGTRPFAASTLRLLQQR